MSENKVIKLYSKAKKAYAAFLSEYYGDRCADYSPGCPNCTRWAQYDLTFSGHDLPDEPVKATKKGGKRATKKSKTR